MDGRRVDERRPDERRAESHSKTALPAGPLPKRKGDTIAIVGASARAAAFSWLRTGRQVVAADLFADADLARQVAVTRVAPYPAGFAPWLAATECDSWMFTGALENYPQLVDRLASIRPLLGHRGDVLRQVRDPICLQATLSRAGLNFPATRAAAAGQPGCGEWLGKTYRGSCGSGVGVTSGALFWQRKISGTPLSVVFVGEDLLGVTRQLVGEPWAGASEFAYCGSIGPWSLPWKHWQQLQRLGKVLCEELGLTDLYGVDLIFDGEKIWTIEVNPRYTAAVEVVERAYGVSAYNPAGCQHRNPTVGIAATGTVATGEATTGDRAIGKVVLYAKAPLLITAELSAQLLQQAGDRPTPQLADIPGPGTAIGAGQPVLTLFAEAASCGAVFRRLQERVVDIERQIYRGVSVGSLRRS